MEEIEQKPTAIEAMTTLSGFIGCDLRRHADQGLVILGQWGFLTVEVLLTDGVPDLSWKLADTGSEPPLASVLWTWLDSLERAEVADGLLAVEVYIARVRHRGWSWSAEEIAKELAGRDARQEAFEAQLAEMRGAFAPGAPEA